MSLDWLFENDRLPHTWSAAFYATVRALFILIAYLATLAVMGLVICGFVGMQMQ